MKALKTTNAALLALLGGFGAFSPPGLMAQEGPYSYQLKIRVGLVGGDIQETHYDNKIMGFAAEVRRDLKGLLGGLQGSLLAELAWEYVPGRHHDIYPWNMSNRDAEPMRRIDGTPLNIRYSLDDRKEYGQGINLKLGYASKVPQVFGTFCNEVAKDMEWFAGLSMDRYKVRSEVKYMFNFTGGASSGLGQYDGGTFVKEESQFVPGAFVGIRYNVRQDFGFELALRSFGMWHYDYVPAAYHAKGYSADYATYGLDGDPDFNRYGDPYQNPHSRATSSTGTSRGLGLDFAITARF